MPSSLSATHAGSWPPPPTELDAAEARIWRAVIDALPAYWIDPAGELVLRRLCAQAAILEKREQRLRTLRAQNRDEEADELAAAHGVAAKVLAHLLTQLRATPRSRFSSRASAPEIASTPKLRPWEIRSSGKAG